ncbi:MAG: hypothetical protein ACXU9C_09365, partial [Xanthobacteraceae bacterium]
MSDFERFPGLHSGLSEVGNIARQRRHGERGHALGGNSRQAPVSDMREQFQERAFKRGEPIEAGIAAIERLAYFRHQLLKAGMRR